VTEKHYALDPSRSSLRVFTYAEGLFARLAHDLELGIHQAEVRVLLEGDKPRVVAHVPLASLRVEGVVKHGALRTDVLSEKDHQEILAKMRDDVFDGASPSDRLTLEASVTGPRVEGSLILPSGKRVSLGFSLDTAPGTEAVAHVKGAFDLSLKRVAGADVKGPLGAFRISDRVHVSIDVHLVAT
jgi:hypothetical protein